MPLLRIVRLLAFSLVTISCAFLFVTSTKADYTFFDGFISDNISSEWSSVPGHPVPAISDGSLLFNVETNSRRFPYLYKIGSDIPIKELSFKFSYALDGGDYGSGIVITENARVDEGIPPNDVGDYIAAIYVLPNKKFYIFSPLCPITPECGISFSNRNAVFELDPDTLYEIKFKFSKEKLKIYVNNVLESSLSMSDYRADDIFIGNPEVTDTPKTWQDFRIDDVFIWYQTYDDAFPYYSQKDNRWKNVVYDNAKSWAGDNRDTIERWGCAITSVAMMLDKYDIKMPNGDVTNPEKINTWLKSQPDGYVGDGLLNWLAISRLVKQARLAGQASTDLEFIKSYGSPSDELSAGLYPIINEGGHFVTLFDQDADNWILNDPNDENRNIKAKTEPIVSVNTYKPSSTDLSYILLVYDQNTKLDVSYGGSIVGSSFVEYINDDVGSNQSPTSNLFYYAEPDDGAYRISVDTANDDSISIYTYDELGNVDVVEQQVPSGKSSWELMYIDNGTDPVIRRLDNDPPVYIGTNKFDGWYNAPQTAVFNFEDANLPSDFVMPSCVIKTEGKGQFCKISTNVCDSENNCKNYDLESNRANIDLTPPKTPKYVMALGFKPYSLVSWSNSKEAERYLIEWGVDKNNLQHKTSSKNNWEWINTPKNSSFYYRVTAVDKAGNLSKPTPIYRVVVKSVIIRW